jgi:hypothetical protein
VVNLLTEQQQLQIEEPGVLLLPRDTYANLSKRFRGVGCFYTIYSKFGVATKGPKTNLSS